MEHLKYECDIVLLSFANLLLCGKGKRQLILYINS